MITSSALIHTGISHGFFTREGGVSAGIYSSLNCGMGSGDDIALVIENRKRVAEKVHVAESHLLSPYQIHSADVLSVNAPFAERPKADGLVTSTRGLALGILTADCGPVLFADPQNSVIGACHAGWKGALYGVTDNTILAMEKLGAVRENIVAVLGPTISQTAYEVGPTFPQPFIEQSNAHQKYFIKSIKEQHYMFDLPAYLVDRIKAFGVRNVSSLGLCTYADERKFFSYRRTTHRAETDYGRLISVIALPLE